MLKKFENFEYDKIAYDRLFEPFIDLGFNIELINPDENFVELISYASPWKDIPLAISYGINDMTFDKQSLNNENYLKNMIDIMQESISELNLEVDDFTLKRWVHSVEELYSHIKELSDRAQIIGLQFKEIEIFLGNVETWNIEEGVANILIFFEEITNESALPETSLSQMQELRKLTKENDDKKAIDLSKFVNAHSKNPMDHLETYDEFIKKCNDFLDSQAGWIW